MDDYSFENEAKRLEEFYKFVSEKHKEINDFKGPLKDAFEKGKLMIVIEMKIEKLEDAVRIFTQEGIPVSELATEKVRKKKKDLQDAITQMNVLFGKTLEAGHVNEFIKLAKKARMKTKDYDTLSSHKYIVYRFLTGEVNSVPQNLEWLFDTYIIRKMVEKLAPESKVSIFKLPSKENSKNQQEKSDIRSFLNRLEVNISDVKTHIFEKAPKEFKPYVDWVERYVGFYNEQFSDDIEWIEEIRNFPIDVEAAQKYSTDRINNYKIGFEIQNPEERQIFQEKAAEELKNFFLSLKTKEEEDEELPPWMS